MLLGTQFAGGVFLTTALTRFHVDSNATFKHLRGPSQASSLSAMFTMMGYLLTMLAEVLVHRVVYNRQVRNNEDLESVTTDGPETCKAAILRTMNLLDTVLLMLTLCFHSVFDGLAIGVSGSYNLLDALFRWLAVLSGALVVLSWDGLPSASKVGAKY